MFKPSMNFVCKHEGENHALMTVTGDRAIVCSQEMLGGSVGSYVIEETDKEVQVLYGEVTCDACIDKLVYWRNLYNKYLN